MSKYDEDGDEDRPCFWSSSEVVRIGLIVAIAIYPLSVEAVDTKPQPRAPIAAGAIPNAAQNNPAAGYVRSVRVTRLDVQRLTPEALGDAE
jgi:hypothetical protein